MCKVRCVRVYEIKKQKKTTKKKYCGSVLSIENKKTDCDIKCTRCFLSLVILCYKYFSKLIEH